MLMFAIHLFGERKKKIPVHGSHMQLKKRMACTKNAVFSLNVISQLKSGTIFTEPMHGSAFIEALACVKSKIRIKRD